MEEEDKFRNVKCRSPVSINSIFFKNQNVNINCHDTCHRSKSIVSNYHINYHKLKFHMTLSNFI